MLDYIENPEYNSKTLTKNQKRGLVAGGVLLGVAGFLTRRFKIAGPSEQIVRTGLGIKNVSVTKKAVQWPFQTANRISIEPRTFEVEIDAMSMHRIPFKMPTTWTIGPMVERNALENYAQLLSDKGDAGIHETVEGVIQGEARVLTGNMTLNEIFSDREVFRDRVQENINKIIDPFGLTIYNANISELADLDEDNRYFSEQKKRALKEVNQHARVNVAAAVKDGTIGEAIHLTETRQETARLEKEAKLVENDRDRDIAKSNASLAQAQAEYDRDVAIARAQSAAAGQQEEAKLQAKVEQQRVQQRVENIRAEKWSMANVQAEIAAKVAEGEANATRIQAEADLFAKQQEAAGILAIRQAEAEGLQRLVESAGGVEGLNSYLLVDRNTLPELAQKQADALTGMNPNISVWNTGNVGENSNLSGVVTDLFKTGMPLFDGIKQQTGYDFLKSIGVSNAKQTQIITDDFTPQQVDAPN